MDLWKSSVELGERMHIPLLIAVTSTFRCADAGCVLSGPRRICGGMAWRLNLGECMPM